MRDGTRYAFEFEIPSRRPGGKPRYVAAGKLGTAPVNDAVGGPEAVVYDTPLGDWKPARRRRRRPDGTLAPLPAPVTGNGQRLAGRAALDAEQAVRADVLRALADGRDLTCRPLVRVVHTQTCAVRTIPYKGEILKWASVEDLVQAIATGAF